MPLPAFITRPRRHQHHHHHHHQPNNTSTPSRGAHDVSQPGASAGVSQPSQAPSPRPQRGQVLYEAPASADADRRDGATHHDGLASPSHEPRLLGRLLSRGKSKKGRRKNDQSAAAAESGRKEAPADAALDLRADQRADTAEHDLPPSLPVAKPNRSVSGPKRPRTAPSTPDPTLSGAQVRPSPDLQVHPSRFSEDIPVGESEMARSITRKPSLRDRFRLKSDPQPTPDVVRRKPPPVSYVPRHAASDFSRMTLSPRRKTSGSFGDDRDPKAMTGPRDVDIAQPLADLRISNASPKPRAQVLQPLLELGASKETEDDAVPASGPNAQSDRVMVATQPPVATESLRTPRSTAPRMAPLPTSDQTPDPRREALLRSNDADPVPVDKVEPSDYQIFLQRAMEEDLQRRENAFRNFNPRASPGPPLNPFYTTTYPPAPLEEIVESSDSNTYYHQQPGDLPPNAMGGQARAGGGGGSKSSGTATRRDSAQYVYHRRSESGAKRESWSPGGNDAEREMERAGPEHGARHSAAAAAAAAGGGGYVGASSGVQYQAQEPRALKRQGSISQRIAEYIRPTRLRSGYEEPQYRPITRSGSKRDAAGGGGRRSGPSYDGQVM